MRKKGANREQVIARLAANQHGVVAARQLAAAGLPDYSVSRRVNAGRLHRLHRGVYAVGHTRLSFDGKCMAAVLALGEGAVVSHHSAGALWGMLKPTDGPIHITLPGNGGRKRRRGIAIHRSASLVAGVSTCRHGIAVTKPARTLRDLHRTVPQAVYQRAVRRALDLHLISPADLKREAEPGFRVLRFTHRQLMQERSAVVAALRPLLGQSPLAPNL
jgi:predicted transcriptional regulator of viral defense system